MQPFGEFTIFVYTERNPHKILPHHASKIIKLKCPDCKEFEVN